MLGLIGFATRVAYTLPTISRPHGDSFFYRGVAQQLADGNGYADPFSALVGNPQPTAQHPPLFSMYLALWTKLGVSDFRAYQIVCCLLGAATVVLIGLLGRQLAGPGPGLIAAGIAALYPPLAVLDSTVNSESLYVPLVVVVLLLAYRYIARPSIGGAVALGLATGLATITRTDGILLLALVAAPVCWRFGRPRAPALAACAAAALLIVTPWIVRNWIQFDRVPLASSNGGHTLMATNCNSTYYDSDSIGFVSYDCGAATRCSQRLGELALSDCWGEEGRTYIDAHLGRLPLVALVRVARVWELYRPSDSLDYGWFLWARPRGPAKVGLFVYALLVPLALAGLFLLRKRRVPVLPLLATFAVVCLVAAGSFGFSRFRVAAEPALIVLAAITLDRLGRALVARVARAPRDGENGARPRREESTWASSTEAVCAGR